MLKLHFINVADGDAILVEDQGESGVFRMLVDTGRLRLDDVPGSLRLSAADYLRAKHISHIDVLVVTHLHIDHFGGLEQLLPEIRIDEVYSGFFPRRPWERIPEEPQGQKTVRGLIECVNQWAADVEAMTAAGCLLREVTATISALPLTGRLTADMICPNETAGAVQRLVWGDMLDGKPVPEDLKYWASKSRNPNSLRLRLRYAGRSLELAGDCYGEVWDGGALEPCDILKVPHHGDAKALTEKLVEGLRPAYAVISCQAEYIPHKDRPSFGAVELLRRQGTRVWFTDAFSADWQQPERWRSVDFAILEDGTILVPDSRESGGRLS